MMLMEVYFHQMNTLFKIFSWSSGRGFSNLQTTVDETLVSDLWEAIRFTILSCFTAHNLGTNMDITSHMLNTRMLSIFLFTMDNHKVL